MKELNKKQELIKMDFEILNEGDLYHIRGGNAAPDASKPATKAGSGGILPSACDNAS